MCVHNDFYCGLTVGVLNFPAGMGLKRASSFAIGFSGIRFYSISCNIRFSVKPYLLERASPRTGRPVVMVGLFGVTNRLYLLFLVY